jgi:hypothetical protein
MTAFSILINLYPNIIIENLNKYIGSSLAIPDKQDLKGIENNVFNHNPAQISSNTRPYSKTRFRFLKFISVHKMLHCPIQLPWTTSPLVSLSTWFMLFVILYNFLTANNH